MPDWQQLQTLELSEEKITFTIHFQISTIHSLSSLFYFAKKFKLSIALFYIFGTIVIVLIPR